MRNLDLPAMTSDLVVNPLYSVTLADPMRGHRIHVGPGATGAGVWAWAHLLRSVSGWKVIASGTLPRERHPLAAGAAAEIARRFRPGGGVDRLPPDRFAQVGGSAVACVRRDTAFTYCGLAGGHTAVFDTEVSGHAEYHCTECDATYRAEHYGRMALPA